MENRRTRLLAGVLIPGALGVFIFYVFMFLGTPSENRGGVLGALMGVLVLLVFAYLFVGVQSVIYSVLMEYYVNPKISSDTAAVIVSGVLGAFSGSIFLQPGFVIIGLIIGVVTGIYLRRSFKNAANKRLHIEAAKPRN